MRPKIVLATQNQNKLSEIVSIFEQNPYEFWTLSDFPEIKAPEESGSSFKENAILKANYYWHRFKMPVIADDSGLVVPALHGEPGIFSARYAGEQTNYQANNEKLLVKMSGLTGKKRQAFFICYTVYKDRDNTIFAEGRKDGIITTQPRGENGFGYDPIFLIPELNKTFAELPADEKNKISHRYKAFYTLAQQLEHLFK
jgi:XTP/dITP diphosphohydrolase